MKDNKSAKKYNEEMAAIINLIAVAFAPFMIVLFILGIGNSAGVGILLLLTIMACLCFAPKLRKYKSKFTKISKLEPVHIKIASKIIAKVRFPKYRTSSLS